MATAPHDWEVVIDCPGCGQRGRVTVRLLKTMVRCPACRTRFVVARSGVKKASREMMLASQTEMLAAQAAADAPQPLTTQPVRESLHLVSRSRFALAAGMVVLLVSLSTAALRWSRQPGPPATGSRDLSNQATQFADALIANNLNDGAKAAMIQPRELTTWWRVRRAAMNAGQGRQVRGELRDVDVEENDSSALVRLTFGVGGNIHVFAQYWEQTPAGWQLQVSPEGASTVREE